MVLTVSLAAANLAHAQERGFYSSPEKGQDPAAKLSAALAAAHNPHLVYDCRGPVSMVLDTAYEGVKTTSYNWGIVGGGGDGGRFDKTPVLSTKVFLEQGTCLNAHFSAIVGSRQTYGPSVASLTMFQVTLTPSSGGAPQHMVGHYDTPYGVYGPAVAVEAERDVDTFGSNFFQRVGFDAGDVPPGVYTVDVWWSGGPIGGGGAIGGAFVLKLYLR
ncbi:MAG: hypothetical protein ACXW2Q_02440 [Thermoanaerobaculia bacterium]